VSIINQETIDEVILPVFSKWILSVTSKCPDGFIKIKCMYEVRLYLVPHTLSGSQASKEEPVSLLI
jgi:hypothetical protein